MRLGKSFWLDRSGNYAVIFTLLSVPILVGVVGMTDLVGMNNRRANVQAALDVSAFAIAQRSGEALSHGELEAYGRQVFEANLTDRRNTEASFELVSAADAPNVLVKSDLAFSGYFDMSRIWNSALFSEVVISQAANGPACVLALDTDASKAIWIQGSTQVNMDGCVMVANSDAGDAISRQGAAEVEAQCAYAAGATEGLSDNNAKLDCPAPKHGHPRINDPFVGVAAPAYTGCKSLPSGGNGNNSAVQLAPGTYCNQDFKGQFVLEPGNYILRGGEIKLGGNGSISGNGVTLFLVENASITFGANEKIDLTAPTEGTYAGLVIFQPPGNSAEIKLNGTGDSKLTGFIYAPDAHVDMTGNASASAGGDCTRIVASTIRFIGNSAFRTDCEAELAGKEIEVESFVRLAR